jgi:hypothetical protein
VIDSVFWGVNLFMTRVLLFAVLLSSRGLSQNVYSGQPWDKLFRQSWIAQAEGDVSKARDLTAEGWTLVKAAGPSAFGYADGVEQAYATTLYVAGPLAADRFYSDALKSTESPGEVLVRLQILIHKAFRFSHQQEVAANAAYEEALALIESMRSLPGYFAQMLRDFAELRVRMGDPESSRKLLARAASAPSYTPIPYPRFGMQDIPVERISGYDPGVKALIDDFWRLIREQRYESARITAEQVFAMIETLPRKHRCWADDHFQSIAAGYNYRGHKSEALAVLEREIAASERYWGSGQPGFARTLESVAWLYISDFRMLEPARELIERAAPIILAFNGETSDAMSYVQDLRLRIAEREGNADEVAELKAKIRKIWVAVHGANTKPLVIECFLPASQASASQ